MDKLIIRITGDSGDGIQLVGEQLTITAALTGLDVQTLPDFPAEIRAPAGTLAGISGFQLAMAQHTLFTAGDTTDVLVALNPAALKHSIAFLKPNGLLILNEDNMQVKDWEKARCDPSLLTQIQEQFQVLSLPLIQLTLQAVAGIELSQSDAKKAKNCYILGVVLWLFELPTDTCMAFLSKKFQLKPNLLQANQQALMAGYNYAMTLEWAKRPTATGLMDKPEGDYRQVTGVEAVALAMASLAVHSQAPTLVAGYPITPSSAILQECAKLADYGVSMFQAEDEISAICTCIGAAYSGGLALTCTSGPGLDLKSESLGLAMISELPLVIIDVQRAGASTGLPTKTGQSDLNQALYGRHGEAPIPVFAPKSPSDCFDMMIEAFRMAIRYMTPVIVMMDAYLALAAQSWKIPDIQSIAFPIIEYNRFPKPFTRDDVLSRSWNIPGTPGFIHQLGGLEKQGEDGQVSYDAANHHHMVHVRAQKIAGMAKDYMPMAIEGDVNAPLLLISWGSTYGSLKSVLTLCHAEGIAVALLHLRYLNPLPQSLGKIIADYPYAIVAELNTGQLCQVLRAQFLKDFRSITQCNGQPFSTQSLFSQIKEMSHDFGLL